MNDSCYICKMTGGKSCEPHCGLCSAAPEENADTASALEPSAAQLNLCGGFEAGLPGLADRDFDL